ncbi:MAG: beta/gamma crystallin-related protein [Gloeotrichia echinulata DEX184]|nr:beta/gamma crystallin family protein [Gloeotrichia echinulata DEX184]
MTNINNQSQVLDKIAGLEDLDNENAAVCSGGRAILYDGPNLTGASVSFINSVPNLALFGFNDKASSIAILSSTENQKWQLFEDVNYGGFGSRIFGLGTYNLFGINNISSSLLRIH